MGARGPTPDPTAPGTRLQRLTTPDLSLIGELEVPPLGDLPDGYTWLPSTVEWWDAYWASDVAKATQADTDIRGIQRLAWHYDERQRCADSLRKLDSPFTHGSQGQLVEHPLTKYIAKLDAEIRQLEDRFGLNPRARAGLGIELAKARRSLNDLYKNEGNETKKGGDATSAHELSIVEGDDLDT